KAAHDSDENQKDQEQDQRSNGPHQCGGIAFACYVDKPFTHSVTPPRYSREPVKLGTWAGAFKLAIRPRRTNPFANQTPTALRIPWTNFMATLRRSAALIYAGYPVMADAPSIRHDRQQTNGQGYRRRNPHCPDRRPE